MTEEDGRVKLILYGILYEVQDGKCSHCGDPVSVDGEVRCVIKGCWGEFPFFERSLLNLVLVHPECGCVRNPWTHGEGRQLSRVLERMLLENSMDEYDRIILLESLGRRVLPVEPIDIRKVVRSMIRMVTKAGVPLRNIWGGSFVSKEIEMVEERKTKKMKYIQFYKSSFRSRRKSYLIGRSNRRKPNMNWYNKLTEEQLGRPYNVSY